MCFAVCGDVEVSPTYYKAMIGQTVVVDCRSTSNETVIWLKPNTAEEIAELITNTVDGKVLIGLEGKYHVEEPAKGHSRLKILNAQPSDEGMFICKQSNVDNIIANMTLAGTLR